MFLGFLHTNLTGLLIWCAIVVALLIAIVGAVIWRLYKKVPPELRDQSKKQ